MKNNSWLKAYLICFFLLYSWVLYHLAYARGAFIEMMGANGRLQSCHALITGTMYETQTRHDQKRN